MVNIVTGYVGKPHIQAAEQGLFNGGVCGDKIVLPTNQQFSYILNSNNSITIQSGDLVNQGRHITVPFNSSETLTIENGKAGYNRIDTVVMRYEKDSSTSVESAKLFIIKGTPSTTAATAPEIVSGSIYGGAVKDDFPLYNINITDLSVTSVTQLFYVTEPLDSLSRLCREQKRQLEISTSGITAYIPENYTISKTDELEALYLSTAVSSGECFEIEDGKVKVIGDISKVMVSANIRFQPAVASGKSARIYKNDEQLCFSYINHGNQYHFSIGISPKLVNVAKGDVFYMQVVGSAKDVVSARLADTYLTLKAIE